MASSNRITETQQMAQTLGIVVGAASCCEQVTEERVNSVAVKLRQLVSATADDTDDADAANEQFSAALEAGKIEPADRAEMVRAMPREFFRGEDHASQAAGELLDARRQIHRRTDAGEVQTVAAADVAVQHLAHM